MCSFPGLLEISVSRYSKGVQWLYRLHCLELYSEPDNTNRWISRRLPWGPAQDGMRRFRKCGGGKTPTYPESKRKTTKRSETTAGVGQGN